MRKTFFMSVFTLFALTSFAQSVSISPNNLQIPSVSVLPACAAADYGKMVFLTTTNKANVCSGSGWVEVAAGGGGSLTLPYTSNGSFSTQGFQIINTGGGANSAALQGTTMSGVSDAAGVWGSANNTAPTGFNAGVRGSNLSTNNGGVGVAGSHAGGGYGVQGISVSGYGVAGSATGGNGIGVVGFSANNTGTGVWGNVTGTNGVGVYGKSTQSCGIAGFFENTSAIGLALLTTGKLRFQGNGAAANKILVSADANGNANWGNPTRSEVLKLGAAAFQPQISTNEYILGAQGISMTSVAGTFQTNISVPDGATITSLKIYYIDNDGTSPAVGVGLTSYAFQKMNTTVLGGTSYGNILGGSGNFTNTSSNINILTQNLTLNEVVDNDLNFYRLQVTMPSSTQLILVGAEIKYTYSVNN